MKSRSEVIAEKKKSASERTVPMFDEKDSSSKSGKSVHCDACEEDMTLELLEKRDDGAYECMHCAAPIRLGKAESKETTKKEASASVQTKSGSFCGECGAEWPIKPDQTYFINCGHMKALRVDDPRKAKSMKVVTPSGVATPPKAPVANHKPPIETSPTVTVSGNRMSIGWGKCTFPVGEARGMKYANMEIAQQIITVELPEGADRVSAARTIMAELQKIADLAFDIQYAWFSKKLDLLDK